MKNEIFVFGSNLAGRHGKGAAYFALMNYGAIYGNGVGIQGSAYAIPTKDWNIRPLSLPTIELYVSNFMQFARDNPQYNFKVTRIGCGLAGYSNECIAPMFKASPNNCIFSSQWEEILGDSFTYFKEN